MTPQKKAIELVERMAIYHWVDGVCKYEEAKQCALIAVDEIIKDLKESLKVAEDLHLHARGLIMGSFVDWQEVKTEIEKL
jgi:hypothetical protein